MLRRRPLAVLSVTALALSGFGALALNTTAQAAPASDLMFSVYIEGSGQNKALEIYNPTDAAVNLGDYTVELFSNGSTTSTNTERFSDEELAAGGHYVIYNSNAPDALKALGDKGSSAANYNGNDALVLSKGETTLDSIGQVGVDPGSVWSSGDISTGEQTLTKTGCEVDATRDDAYDPAQFFFSGPQDDFSTLGRFTCEGLTDPEEVDPPDEIEGISLIGAVQGDGDTSPFEDQVVTVQGHVVGSFQGENQFNGYYVQDAGDDNPATSDGIFVFAPNGTALNDGTLVEVTGAVSESFGQTQITQDSVAVSDDPGASPEATDLTVPVTDPERYEGMLVTFPDELTILEYFNYGRFGEIVVGPKRQNTPSSVLEPGPVAAALAQQNATRRLILDDGRANQNATPAIHPNGEEFTTTNFFRGGDKLVDVTGILSYQFGAYKLQPTAGADYIAANPRPEVPEVGGDFTVASYNVLNYFTTLTSESSDARGADNVEEFERQQIKIVEALADIDADVFGLIEIENNGTAVENLVTALNNTIGTPGTYAAVNTGVLGSDAIVQAFIYKPETVDLAGSYAAYDFEDGRNRPNLVQTFTHKESGEMVNVSVNHLKSKGSACSGDPDLNDGAGNCNITRTEAATTMMEWLDTDPTDQGAERTVVIGDLNSYDYEDPIEAIKSFGYTDLLKQFGGDTAYTYVFDGQNGYLDYALSNEAASSSVTGTAAWNINADETSLIDYNLNFKSEAEQNLWEGNPYRSSDHDPVIVGMQLAQIVVPSPTPTPEPTPAPTVTVTATPTPPAGDIYTTPGFHVVNGRKWMTTCEPYSATTRCFTYIWGTQIRYAGGKFVQINGWNFNNLTYVAAKRALWEGNKLAFTNTWTAADGRNWETECETAQTGSGGCRSYVETTLIEFTGSGYRQVTKFVFNNMVRFSN